MDNRSRDMESYHYRDRKAEEARALVKAGNQLQSYSRPSRAVMPMQNESRKTTTTTVRYQEYDDEDENEDEYDDDYEDDYEDKYKDKYKYEDEYEDNRASPRSVVSRRPNTRLTHHTVATEVCRPGKYAPVIARAVATQLSGRVTRRGMTADIRARGYDAEIETDLGNGTAMVLRQRKSEYESLVQTDDKITRTRVIHTRRSHEYKCTNSPKAIQYDDY